MDICRISLWSLYLQLPWIEDMFTQLLSDKLIDSLLHLHFTVYLPIKIYALSENIDHEISKVDHKSF